MKAKFVLKTQNFILLVLLPALLLLTVIIAWILYADLYQVILSGFDHKLFSVSTATAAFIDGGLHDRLLAPRQIRGLAFDPEAKALYGIDRNRGVLVLIDPLTGGAIEIGVGGLPDFDDLAFDPVARRLYGVDTVDGQLFWLDPRTGASWVVGTVGMTCHGLAFESMTGMLYGSGQQLIRIDPATGKGTAVGLLEVADVRSLTFDVETGVLYGMDHGAQQLCAIDPATGETRSIGALMQSGDAASDTRIMLVCGLAFDAGSRTLYGATDRLVVIDTGSGTVVDIGNPGYYSEQSPLYLRYAEPMRRVKARFNPEEKTAPQQRDLWFLYSQVLGDAGRSVTYVLDGENPASVDFEEMHAPLGFTETTSSGAVPLEAAKGAGEVMVHQTVYIGRVAYWENWKATLKSAYAPIFDKSGMVRGMAGADVNVNRIDRKTQQALGIAIATGMFSLLLAGFVAFFITGRLIEPIRQLKEGALKIAAGEYGYRIAIQRLKELGELSIAFNDLSRTLEKNIEEVTLANLQLATRRCRQELVMLLAQQADEEDGPPAELLVRGRLAGETRRLDSSGWAGLADVCLLWLADSPPDPLAAVSLRRDISIIAGGLLHEFSADWNALSARIQHLFTDVVYCFALLCPTSKCAHFLIRRPVDVALIDEAWVVRQCRLNEDQSIHLSSGQVVLVSSVDWTALPGSGARIQDCLIEKEGKGGSRLAAVEQALKELSEGVTQQELLAGRVFAAMVAKGAGG